MKTSNRLTPFIRLAVIITGICMVSACVGYVQFGKHGMVAPTATAGQCSDMFYLPTLEGPGTLPNIDAISDDDELVEYLSFEILRLREVVLQNNQFVRSEYQRYLSSCG